MNDVSQQAKKSAKTNHEESGLLEKSGGLTNRPKNPAPNSENFQDTISNQANYYAPLVDKPSKTPGKIALFLMSILFIAIAAQAGYLGHNRFDEPYVLAVMGALAGVGVFFLLALVLGFVWLTSNRRSDEFSKSLVNGMESGVLVTDSKGSIVYANKAYGVLTGGDSELELASVESVFSNNTTACEVIYRIANRAKLGEPTSGEFRLQSGLLSSQEGPKWFRLRVRKMEHASDPAGLTVWQLSDITEDRLEQETAFQELQHAIHYLDHAPAGFFSSEPDGSIVYLNATLADWLGIDLALFKPGSVKLSEFVSDNGIQLLDAVKPVNNQPKTAIIDVDFLRESSGRMPVRLYHKVSPGSDDAPGTTRTLVINRLAKEETDSALLDAELRFSRFFNNTPIAIASVSK